MWKELAAAALAVSAIGCGAPKPTVSPEASGTPRPLTIDIGDCSESDRLGTAGDIEGDDTVEITARDKKGKPFIVDLVRTPDGPGAFNYYSPTSEIERLTNEPGTVGLYFPDNSIDLIIVYRETDASRVQFQAGVICH